VATGKLNWTGGTISGALTVASNAVLEIGGTALHELIGPMTNSGLVEMVGTGQLNVLGGLIENLPSGTIDWKTDQPWYGLPNAVIHNAGTLRKSGGVGTTVLGNETYPISLQNSGTLEAWSKVLRLSGTDASTQDATLKISLGSPTPPSGFGKIEFTKNLSFPGIFNMTTRDGYTPKSGDTFKVLTFPSAGNPISCFTGLDLGNGVILKPQFSTNGLSLTAALYATNNILPKLFINRSLGGLAITWTEGFSDWVLESTTNWTSATWTRVPVSCANGALIPIGLLQQFFRLRR